MNEGARQANIEIRHRDIVNRLDRILGALAARSAPPAAPQDDREAEPRWAAACEAFEAEMWPKGPAHGSGSGVWAAHKDRLRDAAQPRLSVTRQPPIAPELWRDAYARIAEQYAVFLERYDLAEDATAEDIIAAIETATLARTREPAGEGTE